MGKTPIKPLKNKVSYLKMAADAGVIKAILLLRKGGRRG
jgi:hypothetical protein